MYELANYRISNLVGSLSRQLKGTKLKTNE